MKLNENKKSYINPKHNICQKIQKSKSSKHKLNIEYG